ncbi:MAG: hypothetical protein J0G32_04995 [Alphaproteobacteria bacterium]|nr:hypothetical protein [Alphaproteobacteria bacterium]OJV15306.1 MAG: hypothetical protein BGO27_02225 [Alphaproteobacteria bacterium 33-17]
MLNKGNVIKYDETFLKPTFRSEVEEKYPLTPSQQSLLSGFVGFSTITKVKDEKYQVPKITFEQANMFRVTFDNNYSEVLVKALINCYHGISHN